MARGSCCIQWQISNDRFLKRALHVPSCYSSTEFLSCSGIYLINYFSYFSKHTSWQSEHLIWEQQNKLAVYTILQEGSKMCLTHRVPQSGLFYTSVCLSAIGNHLESFQIQHHYLCIIHWSLFSSFCTPTYKQVLGFFFPAFRNLLQLGRKLLVSEYPNGFPQMCQWTDC